MKVIELLKTLNAILAPMVNTRVEDMGDFHEAVQAKVNPILTAHGLVYHTWYIRPLEENNDARLFLLDLDLKDDKRVRSRRGRIMGLAFTPKVEGDTVQAMLAHLRIGELQAGIIGCRGSIANAQAEIERFTTKKKEYETELAELTNKLKGLTT
jgi:hypothetical protein